MAATRSSKFYYATPKLPADWVPQFVEAEDLVLGTLITYPDYELRKDFTVLNFFRESELTPAHFHTDKNRILAEEVWALIEADHQTPEYFTVLKRLHDTARLELIGGSEQLTRLTNNPVMVPSRAEQYVQALLDLDARWKVFSLANDLRLLSSKPEGDRKHLYEQVQAMVENLGGAQSLGDIRKVDEVALDVVVKLGQIATTGGHPGTPTGFSDLDGYLGGWNPSDLIILAARPGVGKTSLALSIVERVARYTPVVIFSLEMSAEQITQRLLSISSSIPTTKFKRPKDRMETADWDALDKSIGLFADSSVYYPIYINDTSGVTFSQISSVCHRLCNPLGSTNRVGFVVIDYLQLISSTDVNRRDLNRVQELSILTRNLKNLARELNVPIMVLSQLSRDIERRQGHQPVLADLRESGSIEQDSDIVLFIHREDMYSEGEDGNPIMANDADTVQAQLIIAKHRHGPTGRITLQFRRALTRFESIPGRLEVTDGPDGSLGLDEFGY